MTHIEVLVTLSSSYILVSLEKEALKGFPMGEIKERNELN